MKDAVKNAATSELVPAPAKEAAREVDWAEWRELLLSHRPLRRPWRPGSRRQRVYDIETGQVFVLREDGPGLQPQPG